MMRVLLFLFLLFIAPAAHADDLVGTCVGDMRAGCAVVSGLVNCISNTIYGNMTAFLAQLSAVLKPVAAATTLLAVMVFGLRLAMGERQVSARAMLMAMRIALVLAFSVSLGGLASAPFLLMTDMVNMVAGGAPWGQVDAAISTLVDCAPNQNGSNTPELFNGVLGVMGGGLFSSSSGFFMFFVSGAAFVAMLNLALRAIYTYLLAFMMIAFLVLISPIVIIPTLFAHNERYFRNWVSLLSAAILQPVLLFAFLNMFFGLVNWMIAGIFGMLGGDLSVYWRNNNPMFSWAMMTDPSLLQQYQHMGMQQGTPIEQSFMNPLMGSTTETNLLQPSMFDLGLSGAGMAGWQMLITQFMGLGIVCLVMTALLDIVPFLADSIAGTTTRLALERIPIFDSIKQAVLQALARAGGGGG